MPKVKQQHQTDRLPLFRQLWPHQSKCQQEIRRSMSHGRKAVLVEMATGTGKTPTMATLAQKPGARVLFIVPYLALIPQARSAYLKWCNVAPDVEQAEYVAQPGNPAIIASWQTLIRDGRWRKFVGQVDLVHVDECHVFYTRETLDILRAFIEGGARVVGWSATCYRGDKTSLMGFYEDVAFTFSMRDAINDGRLVPPRVTVEQVASVDLKGLASRSGQDFSPQELDSILRSEQALHEMANLYRKNHTEGQKALMFCQSIRQAEKIADILADRYGVIPSLVHSKQSEGSRQENLDRFDSGETDLMVNVLSLSTGWDCPALREIHVARPTKALNRYTQMIGRGVRLEDPSILDGCDTAEERKQAIAESSKPYFRVFDITDSSRCHQIKTVADVLSEGATKHQLTRVKAKAKDMTLEELDAAIEAEQEADRQAAVVKREADRIARQQMVVGITFDSHSVDILDGKPDRDTPHRREFFCPLKQGKYARQPIRVIPDSYLEYLVGPKGRLNPFWKDVINKELDKRRQMARYEKEMVRTPHERR